MIIQLTEKETEYCKKLLEVKENNISSAEFYIEYLNDFSLSINKFDIQNLTKKYDLSTSFYKAMLKKMEVDESDAEFASLNQNSNIKQIHLLKEKDYIDDEYYKTINIKEVQKDEWQIAYLEYKAYQGFLCDELIIDNKYYQEHTPLGFFESDFKYLAVIQKDDIWMSVIPHEINTMKQAINNAFGNVLVLGLGLGYYAFHVSNKKDVKKVTIIENDQNVINLFQEYILPKFPNKNKIEIVYEDAFKYLDVHHDYDYVFADIWHNVHDGLSLYLKIKKYEAKNPKVVFDYWIEKSILAMLRRQTLTVFEEQFLYHFSDKDYIKAENENDQIINSIYKLTKEYKVHSFLDLKNLINDESLKKLALKI